MTSLTARYLAFSLANLTPLILIAGANQKTVQSCMTQSIRPYQVSVRHIEKGGIGYNQGYTTLEGFFGLNPQKFSTIPFFDIRGHIFNDGKLAANLGLGFRSRIKNRAYGLNGYYDYRNTHKQHYNQVGFGFETLGSFWDFRINAYLPVGKKETSPYHIKFDQFSYHYALLQETIQFAMKGANAEAGFHFGKSKNFNYYAAIGPYYFTNKQTYNVWGAKARLGVKYKNYIRFEISNSYDKMFHNKFQGQLTFNIPFGPKTCAKKTLVNASCEKTNALFSSILQPVYREEIIVVGKDHKHPKAIDPLTGKPYYFVFIDNTSHSSGTYKSPYHSLTQAQDNSSPYDILYVFPGDGTTKGMDSGITLQEYQKLWGSGINQNLQTTQGLINIPAQTNTWPSITNTNIDTLGDAITVASHNTLRGLYISSTLNNAISGSNVLDLDISNCLFENISTFVLESTSLETSSITFNNNRLLNNSNGVSVNFNGSSSLICNNNQFQGQRSVSNPPLEIVSHHNTLYAQINDNVFNENTTGSVRFNFDNLLSANITFSNNILTHNQSGAASSLGSNFVILTNSVADPSDYCQLSITDNTFSFNESNAVLLFTDGKINTLHFTATNNWISDHGGSGFVLATPVDTLTFNAQNNTIMNLHDNGIAFIAPALIETGSIILNHNTITDVTGSSNGIAINQDFLNLNLTIQNNMISDCEGTGIISYAPAGIGTFTLDISNNSVNGCQNLSSNAASGLDIEQFTILRGSFIDNTLEGNLGTSFYIGSTLANPNACFTLTENSSTDFVFSNPVDGTFSISPLDAETLNTGTITTMGDVDYVNACPVTK